MNKSQIAAGNINLDKMRMRVEPFLLNYKKWKAMLTLDRPEYAELWPSVMENFGVCVNGGDLEDPTSSFVAKRIGTVAELEAKVSFVEALLSALDQEGRRFVEMRYFEEMKREEVIFLLHISDSTYKRLRSKVLDTFLEVIGIIPPKDGPFLTPKMTPTYKK